MVNGHFNKDLCGAGDLGISFLFASSPLPSCNVSTALGLFENSLIILYYINYRKQKHTRDKNKYEKVSVLKI